MTSVPLATAATLYHRFYYHFSKDDFDPYVCMNLYMYLSCLCNICHITIDDRD